MLTYTVNPDHIGTGDAGRPGESRKAGTACPMWEKITQTALADLSGYCQQYISRQLKLLPTLLDALNSISGKNSQLQPDPDETDWMSTEYLPLLAASPPDELLEGVFNTFEAYGQSKKTFGTLSFHFAPGDSAPLHYPN